MFLLIPFRLFRPAVFSGIDLNAGQDEPSFSYDGEIDCRRSLLTEQRLLIVDGAEGSLQKVEKSDDLSSKTFDDLCCRGRAPHFLLLTAWTYLTFKSLS